MGGQQSKIDQVIANIQFETGYYFQNKELVREALRHGSVRGTPQTAHLPSFERLEFLGDSILQFVISEYLFKKNPTAEPHQLTEMRKKYVSNEKLRRIAEKLKLDELVEVGQSIRYNSQSYSRYGDMVESLLAAIYLDAQVSNSNEPMIILSRVIIKVWELSPVSAQGGCIIC